MAIRWKDNELDYLKEQINFKNMATFKPKNITVEAVQWKGNNFDELKALVPSAKKEPFTPSREEVMFETDDTLTFVTLNDWIVKHFTGIFTVYSPEAFADTFEAVGNE